MRSLPCLDDRCPVISFYTDNSDWQSSEGWQDTAVRNAMLQDRLQLPLKRVVYAHETHSGSVLAVSGDSTDLGPSGGYDAMVTAEPGVLLCIWTADCPPLFLCDPEKRVAAIAHCGWRGICRGIVSNTVAEMTDRFGVKPEDIVAAFGPGICSECYEVGEDLTAAFSNCFSPPEITALFRAKQNGKYLLDLKKAITFELLRTGILPGNIHDSGICSYESEEYASYRRNGRTVTSRQTLSGIVLV